MSKRDRIARIRASGYKKPRKAIRKRSPRKPRAYARKISGSFSTYQLAKVMGVSPRTVRRFIRKHGLPAVRRSKRLRSHYAIFPEDFREWRKPPRPQRRPKRIRWVVTEHGDHLCTSHALDRQGYPVLLVNGKRKRVAQYQYEVSHGPILPGFEVRPKCRIRRCINPDHLELVEVLDNRARGGVHPKAVLTEDVVIRGRQDKTSTHREFAEANGLGGHVGAVASARIGESWRHLNDKCPPLIADFTPRDEKHPLAKLTRHKIRAIRAAKGKVSATTLAKRFGVSRQTIYSIWNGKSWKEQL